MKNMCGFMCARYFFAKSRTHDPNPSIILSNVHNDFRTGLLNNVREETLSRLLLRRS